MTKKKEIVYENIRLEKLVHGGQAIANAPNGKKLFVWGGLPGELVDVRVLKKKSSFVEGVVQEIHEPSENRIEPKEPVSYLSTSPWQIMTFESENVEKQSILTEAYEREKTSSIQWEQFVSGDLEFGYRNKQEMGFWGDESGLFLAHYVRGSHGKQQVQGSALAQDAINAVALKILSELERLDIWGGKLKTVVLRASEENKVVAALFLKEELDLSDFVLPDNLQGIDIYYSDPKSPASVPTKKLYSYGDIKLHDTLMGKNIMYDVMSFFQVNLPVFTRVLTKVKDYVGVSPSVDFYSGVGTIGLVVGSTKLVESDKSNVEMALLNAKGTDAKVIQANSESALNYIDENHILIVDPPRVGLHKNVVDRILEVCPPRIVYLSCNPSTQARDVRHLEEKYKIVFAQGYNFFPRTPHIESLILLEKK